MNLLLINFMCFLIIIKECRADAYQTWSFDLKDITTKSSNTNLLDLRFKKERVSRGNYALSGEMYLNYDILDGDQNEIEMQVFRSANSDGEYKKIPYEISRNHFYKILNSQYKDTVMETLHKCSDMPYFENEIEQPIEKKTYTLNKCKISQEGLPNHVEVGTYKIVITGYGDVEWQFVAIVEVEATLD